MFFAERPPGWRDDMRAHAIMQSFGCKAPGHEVFPSLRQMREAHDRKLDQRKSAAPSANFMKRLLAISQKNGSEWNPK